MCIFYPQVAAKVKGVGTIIVDCSAELFNSKNFIKSFLFYQKIYDV